jgi:uncharacterized protein (DUF111 family)
MMKKGRPGVVLGVLAEAQHRDVLARIIFTETSTIGLRFHPVSRLKLPREIHEIETSFGKIRVKVSRAHRDDHGHHADGDRASQISPEYDDCRRAALQYGVPLRIIMEEAREAARRHLG